MTETTDATRSLWRPGREEGAMLHTKLAKADAGYAWELLRDPATDPVLRQAQRAHARTLLACAKRELEVAIAELERDPHGKAPEPW